MYAFNYHKPATLDEASNLMANAEDGVYIAGGMTLIPTLKNRLANPSDVIDLGCIDELSGISASGDTVTVGGMTRHAEVAASSAIPALADLASKIGDAQVRNRGTISGSVANSDPAADYPAALLALDATVHTTSRQITADDFFVDLFETALEPGEIITRIEFKTPNAAAYAKFPNPASRYAIVGVFIARYDDGVRVGITGAGPCAFRWQALETALNDNFSPAAVDGTALDGSDFNDDLHASAEYRKHLVGIMAKQSLGALA